MRRQVLLLILLAACDKRAAKAKYTGPSHKVEATPPASCRAGADCAVGVRLTALGDYKVNPDYPFKFVPTPGAVSVASGDFVFDGTQAGSLQVTFRAAAPGTVRVAGTLRLSVCNEDECKIEEEPVSIDVAVGA
jgi:hypothetical protein